MNENLVGYTPEQIEAAKRSLIAKETRKGEKSAYNRRYHQERREESLACMRRYDQSHKTQRQAYMQVYVRGHREEKKLYNREYYQKHREEMLACCRKWYREHREECLTYLRMHYHSHKEEARAYHKAYYQSHREQVAAYTREWYRAHPEGAKALRSRADARRRGVEGFFSAEEWGAKLAEYEGCCAYCGTLGENTLEGKLTVDHIIPLARGGNGYVGNIVPACMSCNREKGAMTAEEFFESIEVGEREGVLVRRYVNEHPEVLVEVSIEIDGVS